MSQYGDVVFDILVSANDFVLPIWRPGQVRMTSYPVAGSNVNIKQFGGADDERLVLVTWIDASDLETLKGYRGATLRTLQDYPQLGSATVDYTEVYLLQVHTPDLELGISTGVVRVQVEFGRATPS